VRNGATGAVTQAAAPAPRAAKPARLTAAAKQAQAHAAQWEKMTADATTPLGYAMDRTYSVGDVIDHPVFGLGRVQKVMKPCTIEVIFQDSVRNLRCGKIA
jgi:hypothetical protein